ncbi:hypothetical protein [Flavobacterium sp.]|nr:hypothetical protein [Flavobacterium sp.]
MRSRYILQVQEIKALAMKDCLLHNKLNGAPSFDFGLENILVHQCRPME